MMIDYIYLNPEERKKYAQSGHEYLIENIPVIIDRRELLFVLGTEISYEVQGNGFFLHKPAKS